jgi:hypothetical protein
VSSERLEVYWMQRSGGEHPEESTEAVVRSTVIAPKLQEGGDGLCETPGPSWRGSQLTWFVVPDRDGSLPFEAGISHATTH